MELFNNFKLLFISVWNKGIFGIDIFEILIGLGIFLAFLIFRGLISKLIIKNNCIVNGLIASPLKGPAGNHEYLIWISNKKLVNFSLNNQYINQLVKETID